MRWSPFFSLAMLATVTGCPPLNVGSEPVPPDAEVFTSDGGSPVVVYPDGWQPIDIDAATTGCGAIEAESAASYPGWAASPVPWTHGGAELSANVQGASFALPFDGTSVTLYYEKGSDRGEIEVTIDGFAPVIVDATAPGDYTWGNATTVATGLPPGPHTATIACAELACDVDYIDVACAAE